MLEYSVELLDEWAWRPATVEIVVEKHLVVA